MDKPILFSTPMVQAILQGRKSQTRRVINPQPLFCPEEDLVKWGKNYRCQARPQAWEEYILHGVKYMKGNRLWVRETYALPWCVDSVKPSNFLREAIQNFINENMVWYKADNPAPLKDKPTVLEKVYSRGKWRPSIFMLKELSRIWLEVLNVRVERLQDIMTRDILKEGYKPQAITECIKPEYLKFLKDLPQPQKDLALHTMPQDAWMPGRTTPKQWYRDLWEKINGKGSWDLNPWVFVIEFRRVI